MRRKQDGFDSDLASWGLKIRFRFWFCLILFLYFTYLILIWFSILENDQFSLWRKKSKFCLRIRLCWNNITGAIRHIDDYRREVQLMIDCLNDWVIIHYSGGDDRFFIQLFSSYPFYSNTIHWLWLVGVAIRGLGWCNRFCHLLICNKGKNFNQRRLVRPPIFVIGEGLDKILCRCTRLNSQ